MHSCESCLFFLLASICTGGILVFLYLGYQNTGEFFNKASEANGYEAPPHDANGYEALPHDLLHRIFDRLEDPRELHRAGATCKAWQNASKIFISFKNLEFKNECDESGAHPQKDLLRAVYFQGDKPNGGKLKEDVISYSFGKDQDDTSSKIFGNVLPADVTNLTLRKKILNQNVCALPDDVRSPPFEFLNTGGFIFDHTEEIGDQSIVDYIQDNPVLNQNVYALSDDVRLPPFEFWNTGGFVFYHTEEIRDQSIADYIQDNPVVKPYVMYDKTKVCICTNDGISLWLGFLTLLILKFEDGKSWGGSFELQHLCMKNGKECKINMPTSCLGTFENLLLDLAKLAKLLIGYFSDKKKKKNATLYVLALYNCMIKPKVGPSSSRQGQLRYLKYLRNHLAFSTSARRISLFKAIYQAFKSMVGDEKKKFLEVLVQVTLIGSWKTKASCHKLLLKMLIFNRDDPDNKESCYGHTLREFLRFLRNLVEHGSEHTIVNGQQLMENVEELDYVAATQFSICIQDMLYSLVMELDMAGRLQIPWNNYCGYKE